MYSWIWRHLPFKSFGLKAATSVMLIVGVVGLLWYVVFPWAEPLLPFDDVQVTQDGVPGGDPGLVPGAEVPAPGQSGDGHDLPYSTESNNAEPTG